MDEVLVSVDVETAGPNPRDYSMISIGACLVDQPDHSFYVELKPTTSAVVPEALAISGLSMEELERTGVEPATAMLQFEEWLTALPGERTPVLVAFNAPFDWMFIDDYFRRFLGRNPFGHAALDVKAYAMGAMRSTWAETSMRVLSPRFLDGQPLEHNALSDARDQARLFRALRNEA
ncbi:MAG: 3'-5' exonuclease [Salinibacterium sp.]|nr:3'-5' exonuclease [Salinibacterium sp.]